jgi:putative flippase GtrA
MAVAIVARLLGRTYVRYVGISLVALIVDISLFSLSLRAGTPPVVAAVLGYLAGVLAHWLVTSRTIFAAQVAATGMARTRQKALFLFSALVGLALTTLIVGGGTALGIAPHLAKLVAITVSFQATYLLRRLVVFAP